MNPIRAKREQLGRTIPQLARRAGVSEKTWRFAEEGRDCKQDTKRKMLSALRVPFNRNGEFFPLDPFTQARFEKMQATALEVMRFGIAAAALGDPASLAKWTLQGLGMLRYYYPGTNQRLHVWSPEHAAPDVSVMHTHPWNFFSTILSGSIENEIYTDDPIGERSCYKRQRIKCGEGGGLEGEPEEIWLGMDSAALYTEGQRYRMEKTQTHIVRPSPGCVSLCDRELNPRADLNHAFVYWPIGTAWVSAEPRPATAQEVAAIVGYALERWQQKGEAM